MHKNVTGHTHIFEKQTEILGVSHHCICKTNIPLIKRVLAFKTKVTSVESCIHILMWLPKWWKAVGPHFSSVCYFVSKPFTPLNLKAVILFHCRSCVLRHIQEYEVKISNTFSCMQEIASSGLSPCSKWEVFYSCRRYSKLLQILPKWCSYGEWLGSCYPDKRAADINESLVRLRA